MKLRLMQRLLLIGIFISEVWTQERAGPMSSECLGNLLRITLSAEYFEDKYLSFSVVDQSGIAWELDEAMAAQCGYTLTYSSWSSIEFRASAVSCHSHLERDVFTVTIQIKASSTPDMRNATTHLKSASCCYGPWSPREVVCESNYMEVSVRREIPQPIKDSIQDVPEDWILVFPEAKAEEDSVWQIVFHQPEEKKALLVSDAWSAGYGLNTTDTRVLLRIPQTAAQVQLVEDQGITFSVVRSSTFYKHRWVILMVDTTVACPADGVDYVNKTITWTVPKYIPSLSAGATSFKDVLVEAGVDLHNLSAKEMSSRKYVLLNDLNAITMKIPVGAEGGHYKVRTELSPINPGVMLLGDNPNRTVEHAEVLLVFYTDHLREWEQPIGLSDHVILGWAQTTQLNLVAWSELEFWANTSVSNGQLGAKYTINLFLEHQWEDNKWGLTKHTIIKEIETPFEQVELTITNSSNLSTRLMNVTVGTFLPDVELVNLTIEGVTVPVPEADQHGYLIYRTRYANGSKAYVMQVPLDAPSIKKEYMREDTRAYTLNVTLVFITHPSSETFTVPVITMSAVRDAVLPSARGFCDGRNLHLIIAHGNVDQNWLPFISDWPLTPEAAQKYNYSLWDNGTHLAISVPFLSTHVNYEGFHTSGIKASLYLTLKDGITLAKRRDFSVSCRFSPSELIQCLPNGTVIITAIKMVGVADLDTSLLVLRDRQCKPSLVTEKTATFRFNVNTCGTSRKFNSTTMTYENEVLYFRPGNDTPVSKLKFVCWYAVKQTVDVRYEAKKTPLPYIKPGFGSLALSMKIFKEKSYSEPYQEWEYPVVKYLREALYFEVELLQPKDARLDLNLDDCWATNSQSQFSFPQWPILINGCANSEDSYRTVFHEVNYSLRVEFPQHLKRFEVRMFTFVQDSTLLQEQLYFHCSVLICNAKQQPLDCLCPRRCNPGEHRVGECTDF